MLASSRPVRSIALNEAACPVDEKTLTQFNSRKPKDAIMIMATLPLAQRARLCQFCYSRAHLHSLALHIASTCDLRALQETFGKAGEIIFEQSRDVEATLSELTRTERDHEKKPVSLPTLCQEK